MMVNPALGHAGLGAGVAPSTSATCRKRKLKEDGTQLDK
jgi:hypothetical protein